MGRIYWKKHFGWLAVGYVTLAIVCAGMLIELAATGESIAQSFRIVREFFGHDFYFAFYLALGSLISLLIGITLLIGKTCSRKQIQWALIGTLILVLLDLIPFAEQGLHALEGIGFKVPFTSVLFLFHAQFGYALNKKLVSGKKR